ncbi:MAG: alpha/beta fold hydrolase [Acidimicrobiia bacterium]
MAAFGLVHGAWHGGWCWDLLAAELERLGHAAVAVDLPCDDWDAGLEDNAAVVTAALDGAGPDTVLVGHSMGGITIPVVAARRPVARLVFLCALVPEPGRSLQETLSGGARMSTPEWDSLRQRHVVHDDGSVSWTQEAAIDAFYHDCPDELGRWAAARLRRQVWTTTREPCPLERWPEVDSSYVLCTGDKAFVPEWSRHVARERLGVEAIELAGGHSPMLSRPRELAEVLIRLAP